jgi:cytochrome c biogenesis protein CcdA
MGGIVITLVVIGGLVAFAGHTIQKASGGYWKIVAGSAAILFGIGALELFPFSLPKIKFPRFLRSAGAIGPGVSGIVFGGAVAVSSLPCNPGIFIILGVAVLQHHILWALVTLISYAIGFSIPLSFLVFGFSLGKNLVKIQKVEKLIRTTAGILLIIAGIYLFYTL